MSASTVSDPFGFVLQILLSLLRASALVAVLPIGGKNAVGRAFLLPFPLAIAICVQQAMIVPSTPSPWLFAVAAKEILLGVALGFMVGRLFIVVGAAGALLDQQAGYTVGTLFNPSLGHSSGPIETLYTLLLILVLMTSGGGFHFPKAIIATYSVWPVAELLPPSGSIYAFMYHIIAEGGDLLVGLALQMAMPIMAMLLFADIAVALLARYASEFNPLGASLAVKALLVALLLGLTLSQQMDYLHRLLFWLTRVQ